MKWLNDPNNYIMPRKCFIKYTDDTIDGCWFIYSCKTVDTCFLNFST